MKIIRKQAMIYLEGHNSISGVDCSDESLAILDINDV